MSQRPHESIAALVPRRLWSHEVGHAVRVCRGVILFADIAGFTRLTESARIRMGTRGIEELTARINAVFVDLVGAAHSTGGDILKFGGDAIIVAFDEEASERDAVMRATRSAASMHGAVARHRRSALRALSLHLGLAHGEWQEFVAGQAGVRREHFVWGPAITRAMDAAERSRSDAGIDCPAHLLPKDRSVRLVRVGPGRFDLSLPRGQSGADDHRGDIALSNIESLLDFVPEALRAPDRIAAVESLSAEHRRVSTVFGFWRCRAAMRDPFRSKVILDAVFRSVHQSALAHDGLWARSDPSGEKQKLLVLFGALSSATDDVDRAVAFACSLQQGFAQIQEEYPALKLGIGISTSTVFTGFVGNNSRREFTAMGDGVNLAARLGARAGHGVTLVDRTTRAEATAFRFEPAGELLLKNVRRATAVFRPTGPSASESNDESDAIVEHPFAMRRCLEQWEEGIRAIRIIVEPGADARNFTTQLLAQLGISETGSSSVIFDPIDVSKPLGGIRRFFDAIGKYQNRTPDQEMPNALRDLLDSPDQRTIRLLSRLGLEAAAREVAGQIIRHPLPDGLILLHHTEFLGELDRRIFSILLTETRGRWLTIEHKPHAAQPEAELSDAVTLGALSRQELAQVLTEILEPGRPSRSLVEFLYARSHGSVRLARSFLTHLQNEGGVTCSTGISPVWQLRNADAVRIPDGLRAHFLQHVDRLPPRERMVLRAISLLGDSAPQRAIILLCRDIEPEDISDCIARLRREGLLEIQGESEDARVTISDTTCRQAVYETMSHVLRESWHRQAAEYWRNFAHAEPARVGEHLFRARDSASARWLATAARRAQKLWSLDRAGVYSRWAILAMQGRYKEDYSHVCPPLSANPGLTEARLFDSLAEILRLQGRHGEAGRIHRWKARIAARSHDMKSSYHHRLAAARMDWYAGHYEKSGRQALDVLRQSRRLQDRKLTAESAYLFGETCRRTGRIAASFKALAEAEALLRQSADRQTYADVLNALGLLHWNCGRLTEARVSFESSLRALARHGDPARRGQVANNLGILLEEQGRLNQAEKYYTKAFATFDRSGVRRHRAYSLGNLANLHRHAARYERARAAYEEVDTELRAMGEAHAAAYTVGNLGDLARDFGDLDAARQRYDATLQFAMRAGDEELKAECYARLAHLHLLTHRLDLMPRLLRKSRDAARRADSREFSLYEQLLRVELEIANGDRPAARRRLASAENSAAEVGLVYYQLWTLYDLARMDLMDGSLSEASKRIAAGMTRARQCGYRWWELRLACCGRCEGIPRSTRARCMTRSRILIQEISLGIGDSKIRDTFVKLPLVRSVCGHLDDHSIISTAHDPA